MTVPDNAYTVKHRVTGYKHGVCPVGGSYNYTLVGDTTVSAADFYDAPTPNVNDITTSIYSSNFVPGFNSDMVVNLENAGTTVVNTTLTVQIDSSLTFVSALPPATSVSGHTLTFTVNSLSVDSAENIEITTNTPSSASLGTALYFTANAPLANDSTPNNNADTLITTVVGSFDPNDKLVNRPYNVIAGKEMIYTIDFQNTGTYQAKNIVVVDTISSLLDMSTFRLLSGNPALPIVSSKDGRRLVFNFNNINLPDSKTNEAASHGNFVYSIQSQKSLPIGDTIYNTAYIYFDFNSAIVTNTTTNVISTKSGVSIPEVSNTSNIQFFPNPTTGNFNIIVPITTNGWQISVTDVTGREIYSQTELGSKKLINCHIKSADGIYFVKVINTTTNENVIKKLLIRN